MNDIEPQSRIRIQIVEKELERCQSDAEEWKREHDKLDKECWFWEEQIAKGNFLFDRILKLDRDIQYENMTGKCGYNADIEEGMTALLRDWLKNAGNYLLQAERIEKEHGSADGADQLRKNIKAVEAMLTPDDEFFTSDKLVKLRDQAYEEHQRGQTEALLEDESRT